MTPSRCPGMDTSKWKPGDIFDVECANCGAAVEFFKDETRRKCGSCGAMCVNPKIQTGCATWCSNGAECLRAAGGRNEE
ncbi:MAG TPA: hypothetical protein PLQ76_08435 [bacterium]|nr:hypothetical protein [bacterium]